MKNEIKRDELEKLIERKVGDKRFRIIKNYWFLMGSSKPPEPSYEDWKVMVGLQKPKPHYSSNPPEPSDILFYEGTSRKLSNDGKTLKTTRMMIDELWEEHYEPDLDRIQYEMDRIETELLNYDYEDDTEELQTEYDELEKEYNSIYDGINSYGERV